MGNARSALFSWLYARHHEGVFVLRVEDTDASRVTEEAYQGVLEDLRWLGLDWDEGPDVGGPHGPYRQSRAAGHLPGDERPAPGERARLPLLVHGGGARGATEGRARAGARLPGTTAGAVRVPPTEVAAFEAEGRPFAIRFLMPEREWVVQDLVKGEVRWKAGDLRDFVIVRSDGSPVFLLAVAVDDMLMGITHVIRGDDLLASAPRNAAVIEALGGTPPAYAHLPQVLGPDSKPLSKRHGDTSVAAFRDSGFLPGGDGQLPRAPRVGEGRPHDVPLARRARRGFRSRRTSRTTRPSSTRRSSSG